MASMDYHKWRQHSRMDEFDAMDERIKSIQKRVAMDWWSFGLAGVVALVIVGLLIWLWWSSPSKQIGHHPMLAKIRYKKLAPASPTRQRLQRAGELFAEGWAALQSEDPVQLKTCLPLLAKAVELDEMACGWKTAYEESLQAVGELLSEDEDKKPEDKEKEKPDNTAVYHSMLTEAYLVLVLHTVVALFGKPATEAAEDYEVVKTRLDRCVRLQPKNPVPYKLRGDWCQRFPGMADMEACVRDFQRAIQLAEQDPEGRSISTHGVDAGALRSYILCYSHFQLGGQMHRKKDYSVALFHYEEAVKHADADFVYLPDAHFNLAILTVMKVQPEDSRSGTLAQAMQHYSSGCAAAKKLRRWMPSKSFEPSKKLAKELLDKLAKAGFSGAEPAKKPAPDKKND